MTIGRKSLKTALTAGLLFLTMSLLAVAPNAAALSQYGITTVGSTNYPAATFGNTGNAANTGGLADTLVATKYTLTTDTTVIKIGGYAATSGHWKLGIYTDNSGSPGTLLAANNNVNAVSAGDNKFDIGPVFLTAGTYWIAILDDTASVRKYGLGTGQAVYTINYGFSNDLPSSYGTPSGTQNNDYVAYCEYVQIEGYAKATKITVPSTTTVGSVNFYAHATGNFKAAIYSANPGPDSKLWESSDTVASIGWNVVSTASGNPTFLTLPAGTYWLVWQWNSPNLGPSYTAANIGDGNYVPMAYGSFPATWIGGTPTSEQWSIYITEGGVTPTPENPLGAVLALAICFGAFGVFLKVRKTKNP